MFARIFQTQKKGHTSFNTWSNWVVFFFCSRVRFREEELLRKQEEREKKKEEMRMENEERERVLEAIRAKVWQTVCAEQS